MGNGVVEQPFRLTQADPVVSAVAGVANTWSDIWTYQVPLGVSLLINEQSTLSTYLQDAGAEVGNSTCQVKVEKRDPSGSEVVKLYGPDLYYASKEFQQQSKMARFNVPSGGVVIPERWLLVIVGKDDAVITLATSYFEARIFKIRKAIRS